MPFYAEQVSFPGNQYLPLAGGTMSGSILVAVDNTIDLGNDSTRWRGVYCANLYVRTSIVGGGDVAESMAGVAAATRGYDWTQTGGAGGVASGAAAGGRGGNITRTAGRGGNGSAAFAAGNGGTYSIDAGAAGTNNGGGAGTNGTVDIGRTNASGVNVGRNGTTSQVFGTFRNDNIDIAAGSSSGNYLIINVGGTLYKLDLLNA